VKVDLEGKVALVTGAARGIGEAIANALTANGAVVFHADVSFEPADNREHKVTMDVTDTEQVTLVISTIREEYGRLDILVNNAGVNTMAHRVNIDKFPRDEWDRILSVDLTGLYEVSRAAIPLMRKSGCGRIVNIASVAGLVPLRLQCAFTAAKAGVINLTKAMAIELGAEGILTNAIAPGSVLTEGTRKLFYGEDGMFSSKVQQMLAHVPLARPGTVEEIAHAALFLAAPESSYINGHCLTVDGGWTAGYMRDF
jgi:NAD(P)-dependent dehydrogenase (short-subunit alcohol dehydrogenase family)